MASLRQYDSCMFERRWEICQHLTPKDQMSLDRPAAAKGLQHADYSMENSQM